MKSWLAAAGIVLAGGVLAAPAGAATIYQNDFESGSTAGFNAGTIQTAPGNGKKFLGFFSNGSSTELSLSGLTPATSITLSFDLYTLYSLDGSGTTNCCGPDYFKVTVDGTTTLMNDTFGNASGFEQTHGGPNSPGGTGSDGALTGTLGYNDTYGQDHTYHLSFNIPITSSTALIAFFGNSGQPMNDEGFGIDNIMITGVSPVPIPAALPLFASGLAAFGWVARRQRKKATATA